MLADNIKCPYCKKIVSNAPIKRWKYGKFDVSRYQCVCGKKFNLYTAGNSRFTIPRQK